MAGTANHSRMRVLKAGPKRTVLLRESSAGTARLVKRFHSPGLGGHRLLGAPGDRRRAAWEARALRRALEAGLPVPTPGKVVRSAEGGWELSMTAVLDAQTLSEILRQAFPGPNGVRMPAAAGNSAWTRARLRRLAERIGALLRQVEAAGLLHADPHPANVIAGPGDDLCIVDLARSRVGAPRAAIRRGLVRALSRMREECPRSFRRRVALAWLGPGATREWTRSVEQAATALRIDELEARVRVWLRTSSATEVRAGFDGQGEAVWVRERPDVAPAGWHTQRVAGTSETVAQIWQTLVRAKLHKVPTCEPRAVSLQPPHAVEYDVPSGAAAVTPEERRRAAVRLAHRGLQAVTTQPHGDPFVPAPDGTALVAPHATLEALSEPPTRSTP